MAKYEHFSASPLSVGIRTKQPRLSMIDRQIAALRVEREREQMRISSREELFAELTDFSYLDPVDEYGIPKTTAYQVHDSVPDVFPVQKKNVQAQEPEKAPEVTE